MNIDISVIVPSWNDRQHLKECLESLTRCTKCRTVEIIVVDNASTDGSPAMVEMEFPQAKLIRNAENFGFSKANNIGMRASQGEYLCLVNSDVKVLPGCLDALVDYMDGHTDIGMIGPRILNPDMTHQSSCRHFPTLWNNICIATGLERALRGCRRFSGEHMFYFKGDQIRDVEVLVGCFWMVRRQAIEEFGLLDESFFMYAEDLDWCRRCRNSDWRVVFYPGAQAIHLRGGSSAKRDPVWVAVTQQRSILRYWKKHHGTAGLVGVSCVMAVHRLAQLTSVWVAQLSRPAERSESRIRRRVSWASLRDLIFGSSHRSL